MKNFTKCIKGTRLFIKMKFEQFVWRLYDRCAEFLKRRGLIIEIDPDEHFKLEDKVFELEEKLFDAKNEIFDLEMYASNLQEELEQERGY